jgi:hypothetical protein
MARPLPVCSDVDGDGDVYQCKTLYIKDLDTPLCDTFCKKQLSRVRKLRTYHPNVQ